MPGGTRNDVSFTSDAFSPKIARKQFLFRSQLSFTFWRYLAHQNIARVDLRADKSNT